MTKKGSFRNKLRLKIDFPPSFKSFRRNQGLRCYLIKLNSLNVTDKNKKERNEEFLKRFRKAELEISLLSWGKT